MHRVNKKVEYALMALNYMKLKDKKELVRAKDICLAMGIPFDATSRVMQLMAHVKILESEQGAFGGYHLIKDLSEVTYFELYKIVLGSVEIVKCLKDSHDSGDCKMSEVCGLVPVFSFLQDKVMDLYKSITLEDLLNNSDYNASKIECGLQNDLRVDVMEFSDGQL